MRNRLSTMAMAAAAFAGLLAGTALADPVTLRVQYSTPENYNTTMAEIEARFEEKFPEIDIVFEPPSSDYETLLAELLRRQLVGQEMPDVAFHGLHRVRQLAERDLVVPLDPFIAAEPDWDALGYVPAMQRLANFGGKSYGLSFAVSAMILYYNADLVVRAGGDPKNLPTTWDAVVELGRKIDALGPDVEGIYWFYYESNNNWSFHSLLQNFGGTIMTPDESRITFDGPEGLAALNLVRQFGEAGMVDMSNSQARQSFSAGRLGIYLSSSSQIASFSRAAEGNFTLVTTPVPRASANATLPAGGAGVMMHTTDPEKQKAAWEFIKFAAGPIGQTIMANNTGYMPGSQIAVDDPELLGTFYKENPNHLAPVEQLPIVTAFFTFPGENSLKIPDVIRDALYRVVTLKGSPEDELKKLADDVTALLARE